MKDYLEKIESLINELEAGSAEIKDGLKDIKNRESLLDSREEKLRAIENDVNARMRIAEKYESIDKIKSSIERQSEENAIIMRELIEQEARSKEAKDAADKAISDARTEREIVNKKLAGIKEAEAALKAREERLKTDFIKKLEAELGR